MRASGNSTSGSFELFKEKMEDVLNKLSSNSKFFNVCGDFNVDILQVPSVPSEVDYLRLLNLFKSSNLFNIFSESTRLCR